MRKNKNSTNGSSSPTGIRVITRKEVSSDGHECYRVLALKAKVADELPVLYLEGKDHVVYLREDHNALIHYQTDADGICIEDSCSCIVVDNLYNVDDFHLFMQTVVLAGDHLHSVETILAEKRLAWCGKVVFVDGKEDIASS